MNQSHRGLWLSWGSFLVILGAALLTSPCLAQVNGSGPSPASAFDTVLNLPGDEAVITNAAGQSIGGTPGQTTQLNVDDGGTVGNMFGANSGSEVNVSGGTVGSFFNANSGSEVNISGGTVGDGFDAFSGSVVNLSGGVVGPRFSAQAGSMVNLIGGEFRFNGADVSGSTASIDFGGVLTGTLADGSSFIFGSVGTFEGLDGLGSVNLQSVALPPADLNPILVNSPIVSGPSGLRSGQSLTLQTGGSLGDSFAVVDATLNVEGGTLGDFAEVSDGVVNISGGTVGDGIVNFFGSEVNISGGVVGDIISDGVLNISGGTVAGFIEVGFGEVNISGGTFDSDTAGIFIFGGGVVNVSGGSSAVPVGGFSGSEVNVSGGIVDIFDLGSGSLVNITGGTVVDDGLAFGAGDLNISGGTVGDNAEVVFAEVNISGGTIGALFGVLGSEVNVSGGVVDGFVLDGSQLNLFGSEFFIDGVELDGLLPGQAFTIADRDVTLSGLLSDGEQFSFDLDSDFILDSDSSITVTSTVPEPSSLAMVSLVVVLGLARRRRG